MSDRRRAGRRKTAFRRRYCRVPDTRVIAPETVLPRADSSRGRVLWRCRAHLRRDKARNDWRTIAGKVMVERTVEQRKQVPALWTSIDRPDAWRNHFQQMPVRI